jgi:hypothetical protein
MKIAVLIAACAGLVSAAPVIEVWGSLAPNAYGSPSWPGWQHNLITALIAGAESGGEQGTPTRFETVTSISSRHIIVSGVRSWMGYADPGAAFGAPFANELGNRLHSPVHIDGRGETFAISNLRLTWETTGSLPLDYSWTTFNYSNGYVGLNYGADGAKGTGDDVWITSGANTQLVHEFFGRGGGNAWSVCEGGTCPTLDQQQAELDNAALYPGHSYVITATYRLLDGTDVRASGSRDVTVNPTPEPTTLGLLASGIGLMWVARRRS